MNKLIKSLSHRNAPTNPSTERLLVGWNEWCALPELQLPAIKAKIDTGAKTSALHADCIEPFKQQEQDMLRFLVYPLQNNTRVSIPCVAPIVDERWVMSSNGHKEHRYVISTLIQIQALSWSIELTLSNRDPLKFRMLLGREAMNQRLVVDPSHRLWQGKKSRKYLQTLYQF